ncbi:MAG: hypothetical protein ABR987_19635 [Terracidiphilus sp.]|jgi:hypothetical protein
MSITTQQLSIAVLVSAMALSAAGQTPPAPTAPNPEQAQPDATATAPQLDSAPAPPTPAVTQLLSFKESDVKFDLRDLMEILRDRRHEGWVLAAYPDPKTGHPLIGAGFSLDLPAREHPQPDQSNPHPFLEPSSAELWQAAGLDPDRLHALLDQFQKRQAAWSKKGFRKKIKTLTPQITDGEAMLLLRVAAIQAIYNARGYCRDFDQLTGSQQIALSQLVYQMGVNLQHFSQFLDLINNRFEAGESTAASLVRTDFAADVNYWKNVQQSLVQSQWARLYRTRAVAVIAMLDPKYVDGPGVAEQRVGAMLHPAVAHRHAGRPVASPKQVASRSDGSSKGHSAGQPRRGKSRQQRKRGV